MSESALRNWGAEKAGEPGDKAASERDLVGGVDSSFGSEEPFDEEAPSHAEEVEAPQSAPAKDAKKSKKPLLIGLSVAAVLLVGAAVYKKTQQHAGGPMIPATAAEESVEAAVARPGPAQQDQGSSVVATPAQGEGQIVPVLGAEPVMPEASAPSSGAIAPAPSSSMPIISQAPTAPAVGPGRSVGTTAPAVAATPATVAPTQLSAVQSAEALAAQEAQKQLVASLQSDVAELRKTVARLQGELASRPATQVAAAPKAAAPRPPRAPEAPKPRAAEAAPSPAPQPTPAAVAGAAPVAAQAAAPAQSKGKVRTDYRIYAVVEGRVWVKQGDNESEMVDVRSPLLDGSTVLSVDPAKPAVVTSAGEIRTR